MIWFLLLTALTVSIDSFVCGFSLSLQKHKKLPIILGITSVVTVLCTLTYFLAGFLSSVLTERTANLGGIILICIGIYNSLYKKARNVAPSSSVFKQSLLLGLGVGLDGAVATLSLTIMGINAFYVPLLMALMHFIMITIGVLIAKLKLVEKFAKIEQISPLVLIVLGGYKLLGLFI